MERDSNTETDGRMVSEMAENACRFSLPPWFGFVIIALHRIGGKIKFPNTQLLSWNIWGGEVVNSEFCVL